MHLALVTRLLPGERGTAPSEEVLQAASLGVLPQQRVRTRCCMLLRSEHILLLLLLQVHLAHGATSGSGATSSLSMSRSLFPQGDLKTGGFGKITKCYPIMPSP